MDGNASSEEEEAESNASDEEEELNESSSSEEEELNARVRSKRAISNVKSYYPEENQKDYYWDDEIEDDGVKNEEYTNREDEEESDDEYIQMNKKKKIKYDEDSDEHHNSDDDWSEPSSEDESEEDVEDFEDDPGEKRIIQPLSDYEKLRQKNVERNNERLKSLGLLGNEQGKIDHINNKNSKKKRKKERYDIDDPKRKSDRSTKKVNYIEEEIPEASDIEALYSDEESKESKDEVEQKPGTTSFEDFRPAIGNRIKKDFDGTIYIGKVVSGPRAVRIDSKSTETSLQWGILYDDGDEEDMDKEEIYNALVST